MQKHLRPILFSVACLFLFSACAREEVLDRNKLFGTWNYSQVELLGNTADSLVPLSGTFVFEEGTEIGASGFGSFAQCKAQMPYWSLTGFVHRERTIYLGEVDQPRNFNYKHSFSGYYAEPQSSSTYLSISLKMSMKSDKELLLMVGNQNSLTNRRFQTLLVKLTR
jgi:hypothetical protein